MTKNENGNPILSDSITVIPNVQRVPEFFKFARWLATPRELREPKTQKAFAQSVGVCEDTLSDWKKRPHFWSLFNQEINTWIKEGVPDVVDGLYFTACNKGTAKEVELFLRLAGIDVNKPKES